MSVRRQFVALVILSIGAWSSLPVRACAPAHVNANFGASGEAVEGKWLAPLPSQFTLLLGDDHHAAVPMESREGLPLLVGESQSLLK